MRPTVSRSAVFAPLAALGLWLVSSEARAWPVDVAVRLEPDKERFHKLSAVDWVEVEDPAVVTAEVLTGSSELLLTGLKPGRTLLLLYAEGKFAVWALTVAPTGASEPARKPELLAVARKACPGLKATEGAERSLTVEVKDTRCRDALRPLLETEAWLARELDLTFALPLMQEQLAALTAPLKAQGLRASYHGAGLRLEGSTTPEGHRKALWALFRQSLGRVPLEDRVEVQRPAPPEDAGTPKPLTP
ncbi:pilus assembly protein N-terminal domain-containing protein [Archangium primigenium]|uniref:pilus assembly protein N-terminal domain-containing protein n=1 Tax=[Archangium] primigenium TaxID=2792470 RepID=UPI00195DB7CB|nr:pilus assembly protein N-terminal domain-containing protein [Archangium primigenium]MBM7118704.1 pilus assembly protein N-terminal domain-containing protein [Archangium primigenium]